jgi:predicted homoserine dehydrogenase-like protein
MAVSFTDGTRVQIEQALVANGLGADIAREELLGPAVENLGEAARLLADAAARLGRPVSDYALSGNLPQGVFIVAAHRDDQRAALRYLKMGEGPYYTLSRNSHLVHLEAFRTLDRVVREGRGLLDNGPRPRVGVAAVAKRELRPGDYLVRGSGSFDVRGVCVHLADRPAHLPIGLCENVRVRRMVEPGAVLTFADVEAPDSLALRAWREVEARALSESLAPPVSTLPHLTAGAST